ncbi:MAG: glucans biosynthesis glucosyltransferase MdoH, partial [Caulobacteraceae bacterium]|nr:glucans biosynthesis glucosyltransferase MdoH [Caulobacteraceae bacterium]
MPIQSLWSAPPIDLASPETRREGLRGVVLVLATLALTLPAVRALFAVLRVDGVTALDVGILIAFALLFAWIALSFVSAVAGLAVGRMEEADPCLDPETTPPNLNARTAILLPIYNEPPRAAFARLRAMARSLEAAGATEAFDIFVLSDTTRKDVQAAECALFHPLRAEVGVAVYYRHRARNTDRKAGNIADWVRRFGGAYAHMVVLDADSLMSGDTLVRLAAAMERNPRLGLLQTTPVLVNLNSLLARAQQFASRLYGPLLSRGIAWWSGGQGNYWGHNAIIRVRAFAEQAGLPHLPGRKPFGGHIMSHDFVEAALMRRAGWEVRMAPLLGGSYEETPPTLSDLIARDRRWCQGNLQHLMVLPSRGLHWISRLHLLRGVSSYLTAPIWLALLIMGVILALRPDLGAAGWSDAMEDGAHPDSSAVLGIFAISMGFLLAPKLMAFGAMLADPDERRRFGGGRRAFRGLMLEMALSTLIAPILMLNQVRALASIL